MPIAVEVLRRRIRGELARADGLASERDRKRNVAALALHEVFVEVEVGRGEFLRGDEFPLLLVEVADEQRLVSGANGDHDDDILRG